MRSDLGIKLRFSSWPTALIGIVVIKAVLSLALKPGSFVFSYGGISYFLLLLIAAGLAIRNGVQNTLGSRPFWVFLAIAYSLWSLDQWIFIYYEHVRHVEVPNNSIADPVLFLHVVPLLAAVATLANPNVTDRKLYRPILNFLLLVFFWSFLYAYAVVPYQYLFPNATSYAQRFDTLYLLENWVLVLAAGILSLRVQAPWKAIYLHLLGASILYALSSAAANIAIDSGGYVNGRLYGLGLLGSVCWFVWIPLRARQLTATEAATAPLDSSQDSPASAWVMLVVVIISIPIVWELFHRDGETGVRTFRLLAAVAAIVCLSGAAYIKEYLVKSELASRLGLANDRIRLAVEAGKSVGWDWDIKSGRDTLFGDLKTVFGISSDTYVGHVEDFRRRVHPDDQGLVWKAVNEAMRRHQPYAAEFRIQWPDGTVRWVAARGQFYYGTTGNPVRMLGMAADITEHKRAEEAVRESEERFRLVADTAPVLIWMAGPDKLCTYFNKPWLDFTGRSIDLELGNGWAQGVHPDDLQRCLDTYTQAFDRREEFRMEYRLRRHDGEYRWVLDFGVPRFDQDRLFVGYIGSGIDVTERKHADQVLRESEERFHLAAQAGKMFAYEWDAATDVFLRSPEAGPILGIEDAARTTGQQALGDVHPDDRERLFAAVAVLSAENPHLHVSYRIVRPDGKVIWLDRTSRAHFDEHGKMLRIVGMAADITERKRVEEALSGMNRKLIEAQEQERSRIARELHDDLGQRLALLANELEQFQQSYPDLREEVSSSIRGLQNHVFQIAADVQSLSHALHSSKLEYLGIAAAMRGFCQEFGRQQKAEIDFKSHDVPSPLPPDISLCLFRVLQECLHNSIKHSGVRHVEVGLWGTSDEIHLAVSDSGAGFDSEAVSQNRGLGLISMEERLKLVKGTFSIESQPERGTTIHASVPLGSGNDSMRAAG